jgi:hypothetical protein
MSEAMNINWNAILEALISQLPKAVKNSNIVQLRLDLNIDISEDQLDEQKERFIEEIRDRFAQIKPNAKMRNPSFFIWGPRKSPTITFQFSWEEPAKNESTQAPFPLTPESTQVTTPNASDEVKTYLINALVEMAESAVYDSEDEGDTKNIYETKIIPYSDPSLKGLSKQEIDAFSEQVGESAWEQIDDMFYGAKPDFTSCHCTDEGIELTTCFYIEE